jgi:hypothetical protein
MRKFIPLLILLFVFSCSSQKSSDVSVQRPYGSGGKMGIEVAGTDINAPAGGAYSFEIGPASATRSSTIYLNARGFNLSSAKIEWLVNGAVTTSTGFQFKASGIKKGDKVQARALIGGKEILSNIVDIRNSPPEMNHVKTLPEVFKPGEPLSVEASASDADGDAVTISYEWAKNGEPAGDGRQLSVPLKRGDKVSVKITPFDGEDHGRPVILNREIANLPPIITESYNFIFSGNKFTYQIKAADPDGDPLTYSLKSAPSGMTVDPSTGLVIWNVPSDFKEKASFTISVADGHGGEETQALSFGILPREKKQ